MPTNLLYNSAIIYDTEDYTYSGMTITEGLFRDAVNMIADSLSSLALVPVTDPRNARPLTVFVELPTFTCFNSQIADITCDIRILGAPPSNSDTTNYILTVCDTIMDSEIAVISGQPSVAQIGSQELPAYDLTIKISAAR